MTERQIQTKIIKKLNQTCTNITVLPFSDIGNTKRPIGADFILLLDNKFALIELKVDDNTLTPYQAYTQQCMESYHKGNTYFVIRYKNGDWFLEDYYQTNMYKNIKEILINLIDRITNS